MKYIGIDIGDGESAVALLEENSVIEPSILPIDGYGSIVSIVGMSDNEVRVGEKALLDRKVAHLRSRFKSRSGRGGGFRSQWVSNCPDSGYPGEWH